MKAIIFDFGLTLVHSERWFDIEIETLIEDSLDIIEKSGIIKLSKEELVMARNFYLELREKAREIYIMCFMSQKRVNNKSNELKKS
ncbi:unnamed protein product [marine sediment metagenome]|uniref:Uncharacterized protein n=1 Tax=marine sediment metagenome TaxID=412755 RepID=X1ES80_9ZZZZ